MATPREILRRARGRSTGGPVRPTPQPAPVPARAEADGGPAERQAIPQPVRGNSVYHQLMLRHDRVNSSHLRG